MFRRIVWLAVCAVLAWPLTAVGGEGPPLRELPRHIVFDQKAIWTSPFHMTRRSAPVWLGFAAATAALIATDRRTSDSLPVSGAWPRAGRDLSRFGATWSVAPFAGGVFALGLLARNEKAREAGYLSLEALLDSAIVVQTLKYTAGRARPTSTASGRFFQGGMSFPSGHTIAVWSLASVMAREYGHRRYVPFLAYGVAAMVGGARVTSRAHFASDVLAGGAMGWFIGRYVYRTRHTEPGAHALSVAPVLNSATATYGVSVRLGL